MGIIIVYKPTNITGGPILYGVPVFPWRYEVVATYWASGPILWNTWKQCTRRSTTCGASNGGAGTWEGQGHGIFGVEMLENAGKCWEWNGGSTTWSPNNTFRKARMSSQNKIILCFQSTMFKS